MSNKMMLKNVRLSFPSLFKKAEFDGNPTKFEATFLLDKTNHAAEIAKVEAALKAEAEAKFGVGKVPKSIKMALQDGDLKDYDGYEGQMSLKAASNRRPTVIDRDKTPLAEEDGKPYAGCYVNAIVDFWVQDNGFGKRVNCNLLGVQFAKDGDGFGAGDVNVTDDFDAVDFDDDEDMFN